MKDERFDPEKPDEDVRTQYGYDRAGRQVWVKDALGHMTVTQYDAKGRIAWTARNWTTPQFDADGYLVLPVDPPAYDPAQPDAKVATVYGYDDLGRVELVTEHGILTGDFNPATRTFSAATTRVTRTEYDQFNRPIKTTLNYRADTPAGKFPDVTVQSETRYEDAKQEVWHKDALGRWTAITYDPLNRPVKVIRNYENGNPLTVDAANKAWTDGTDTDLITITRYTPDGQPDYMIENVVDERFTVAEPSTDRVTNYTYDAVGRLITTTFSANPATRGSRTDTNRTITHAYDKRTGRLLGTQDALGQWMSQQYNDLGRVKKTIQNCRTSAGVPDAQACGPQAASTAGHVDRNIATEARYDALGRVYETVDALNHITRTQYDGVGRPTTTTQNHKAGAANPQPTDQNVTTHLTYDALGRVTTSTDAATHATRQSYNGLGYVATTTDRGEQVSSVGTDGTGTPRWQRQHDGRLTLLLVDGLGRTTATIQNYQDGEVAANEPVDQDLQTRTTYDAAGRRVRTTDALGRVTAFGYDLLDRLVWVQENARDDCASATLAAEHQPCNVTTRYRYDRLGNRTAITDARATAPELVDRYTRKFTYDAADRQLTATDALGRPTTWTYDAAGQVRTESDQRGSAATRTFTYDELGRPNLTQSPQLAATIDADYDALGRRTYLRIAAAPPCLSMTRWGASRKLPHPPRERWRMATPRVGNEHG